MDIIKTIRDFVEEECKKPSSKYGYEPFLYHFASVVNYASDLVDDVGGDREVVILAAWMHDIGSIIHGRKDHHATGAEIAVKKLGELGYPEDKIELVRKCIFNHRGSKGLERTSIEEQIVADADSMSAFTGIQGLFRAALVSESKSESEARKSVMQKLENKWNGLHFESSKEKIKPMYEAVRLLLGREL